MANNFGLGRGLSSLIPPKNNAGQGTDKKINITPPASLPVSTENKNNVEEVDIAKVVPNPHQPRMSFDGEKLQELSNSIKEHGIIQPIIVTENKGQYEIIAGERRLQAAKMAGFKNIPAVVRKANDQQKLELAITENVQRHDLNPVEEAKSYLKLSQEFDLSQEEVAKKVGKSRSAVANKLRLLNLPVEIQKALIGGQITEGHAKAILALENPEKQRALFEMIVKNSLTVRQAENKTKEVSVRTHKRTLNLDPEIKEIEDELTAKLGTKVKVSKSGEGGRIIIDYYSKEELDSLRSKFI